jgi:hypothetical protein
MPGHAYRLVVSGEERKRRRKVKQQKSCADLRIMFFKK